MPVSSKLGLDQQNSILKTTVVKSDTVCSAFFIGVGQALKLGCPGFIANVPTFDWLSRQWVNNRFVEVKMTILFCKKFSTAMTKQFVIAYLVERNLVENINKQLPINFIEVEWSLFRFDDVISKEYVFETDLTTDTIVVRNVDASGSIKAGECNDVKGGEVRLQKLILFKFLRPWNILFEQSFSI